MRCDSILNSQRIDSRWCENAELILIVDTTVLRTSSLDLAVEFLPFTCTTKASGGYVRVEPMIPSNAIRQNSNEEDDDPQNCEKTTCVSVSTRHF